MQLMNNSYFYINSSSSFKWECNLDKTLQTNNYGNKIQNIITLLTSTKRWRQGTSNNSSICSMPKVNTTEIASATKFFR